MGTRGRETQDMGNTGLTINMKIQKEGKYILFLVINSLKCIKHFPNWSLRVDEKIIIN